MVVVKYTTDPVGVANSDFRIGLSDGCLGFWRAKSGELLLRGWSNSISRLDPSMYRNDDLFLSAEARAGSDVDHAGEK